MAKDRQDQLPIDRGWAWVIVAAASCLFGVQVGAFKSQGILLLELSERFEGIYPTSMLIWVFSVKYALGSILAPLVGYLVVKFTHRTVAAIGIIFNVIGYISMGHVRSLPLLLFLHSIISGVGEEIMYVAPLLVSGAYFRKRKALALGLIASGSGIGTMLIPRIYRMLFDNFPFNEACLYYGGFLLQFLIPVFLLRPISYFTRQGQGQIKDAISVDIDNKIPQGDTNLNMPLDEYRERSVSFNHQKEVTPCDKPKFRSTSHLPLPSTESDIHYTSVGDIPGSVVLFDEKADDIPTTGALDTGVKEKFLWRVILMPKYCLIAFSLFCFVFGLFPVHQALPVLGKEIGLSKDTVATALMVGGAVEIPARIINGLIADRKLVTNTTQYSVSIMALAIMCLLCAIYSGLAGISLVIAGVSVFGSPVFGLLPVVIGELVGHEYVTSGMTIQLFLMTGGFLSTSYISGRIYNMSGSWRMVYYYIAGVMMLSSLVVLPYSIFIWSKRNCRGGQRKDSEEKG